MLFSSMLFLWVFLPFVIITNFVLEMLPYKNPKVKYSVKNGFLLLSSLVFYAWGGVYYLLIMISSILLNFFGGKLIDKYSQNPGLKKLSLIATVFLNLAILFFFKYFNMLGIIIESVFYPLENSESVFNSMINMQGSGALDWPEIVLPIGISFFTFQSMSYVIDVYRRDVRVQNNLFDFALYVSLFPQLIAGPIVKYKDVNKQLRNRKEGLNLFVSGQKRFCYGLGKKVLIANTFGKIADEIWALETSETGTALVWFGVIAYTIQIYYDFSGYSDMAIGIGRMLGFKFKENFDYPYTSLSVQEFWRRWHISLSTWFKEYVYIPLGGNRKGKGRTLLNLSIVFILTGIWHGANFTFIWWGIYYGIILIIERLFLGKLLEKNPIKLINRIYTLLAVIIGWVYFRSGTILQANELLRQMFVYRESDYSVLSYMNMFVLVSLVFAVLFSGFVQRPLKELYQKNKNNTVVMIVDYLFQMLIMVVSVFLLVSNTYNPFIYFQF